MPRTRGWGRTARNQRQKPSQSRTLPVDLEAAPVPVAEAAPVPVASERDRATARILQDLSSSVNLPPEDEASRLRKKLRSAQASRSRTKKQLECLKVENASLRSEAIREVPNKKRKVCSYSAVRWSVITSLISHRLFASLAIL